ncbi:MAG: DUF2933 domain-containing protein [Bdellovibrionales bacterium]|nr:DUF2933 domain-containing protein [Bdellovibrionales bacterium]
MHDQSHPNQNNVPGLSGSQKKVAYILVAAVVGYYLWGWHREHVLQYWPFAIFLLCPLMHLFHGHGGHGGGGGGGHQHSGSNDDGSKKEHGCH